MLAANLSRFYRVLGKMLAAWRYQHLYTDPIFYRVLGKYWLPEFEGANVTYSVEILFLNLPSTR